MQISWRKWIQWVQPFLLHLCLIIQECHPCVAFGALILNSFWSQVFHLSLFSDLIRIPAANLYKFFVLQRYIHVYIAPKVTVGLHWLSCEMLSYRFITPAQALRARAGVENSAWSVVVARILHSCAIVWRNPRALCWRAFPRTYHVLNVTCLLASEHFRRGKDRWNTVYWRANTFVEVSLSVVFSLLWFWVVL